MEDVDGGSKIEAANVEEVIRTTRSKVVKKIKDTTGKKISIIVVLITVIKK